MQYLLKINLTDEIWRLIAIDGDADIAFVGDLISLSFNYPVAKREFIIGDNVIKAGSEVSSLDELKTFDSLNLMSEDEFLFVSVHDERLEHKVKVMKAEEKLYCVIPSTLMGCGLIKDDISTYTLDKICSEFANSDDSLNLKDCTMRMRALGIKREDINSTLQKLSNSNLKFNLQ